MEKIAIICIVCGILVCLIPVFISLIKNKIKK